MQMPIPKVDHEWVAVYNDNTELPQNYGLGEANGEHHFGHIQEDKLASFWLQDKQGKRDFGVLMAEEALSIKGLKFYVQFPKNTDGSPAPKRLIYFRRVSNQVHMGEGFIDTSVRQCIGLQATVNGKNYQQLIFINADGSFTLAQVK